MYGDHVHAAVLAAKEQETGITVHLVDEHYDQGKIIAQCKVPVLPTDTKESLALRVKAREGTFFVEVLQQLVEKGFPQTL
jgi:phosphoribosylglycinamide formyltransferase-1